MSGPKVVRIVTREEIEEICRGHLRDVDLAIDSVRSVAKRNDVLDAKLEAGLEAQRAGLRKLMDSERWMDVQKAAPAAVSMLEAEAARIREVAVAAIATARSKHRRIADAARSVVAALEARGLDARAELRSVMSTAPGADPPALGEMERAVSEGLAFLARSVPVTRATEDGGLAKRLGQGGTGSTLGAWMRENMPAVEARDERLDRLVAEVHAWGDAIAAAAFGMRAEAIATEPSAGRRALLTDSLTLEASQHLRERVRVEAATAKLRGLSLALKAIDGEAMREMEAKVSRALAGIDVTTAESVATQAQAMIVEASREAAATARRRAVLQGLSELGYEVRGDMATAWAAEGRVIVRKPGTQDYGVELGAPGDAARVQVRLVGAEHPAAPRDARRDRDQEVTWCSDFGKLGELLQAAGTEMVIDRAIEAGVQPVKTVGFELHNDRQAVEPARKPIQRTFG